MIFSKYFLLSAVTICVLVLLPALSASLTVKVVTSGSKSRAHLDVSSRTTIGEIKGKLSRHLDWPQNKIEIIDIDEGNKLEEGKTLRDYGIDKDGKVIAIIKDAKRASFRV